MSKYTSVFGNEMPKKVIAKAEKTKAKFIRKFGDDGNVKYTFSAVENEVLAPLGTKVLVKGDGARFSDRSVIIGNIRMGFGHYRISMAMASCAHALGFEPVWLDLNSFPDSTCTKLISYQNDLYSMGSRLSDKSRLFNKLYWEPLNSEGFRKLSYNACDQAASELTANLLRSLPKTVPFVATHAWPAQAAVCAGFERVVNAIPDNWPMALHLAEGSLHTVQTPSSFLGYKALRGMDKKRSLRPIPDGELAYTGHYVDHEFVSNLENDTALRVDRIKSGKAKRYLLTVGGAGAQKEIFRRVIETLLPEIKAGKATLFLNVGDHKKRLGGAVERNSRPCFGYAVRKRLPRRVRIRRTGSQWRRERHLRVLSRRYFRRGIYNKSAHSRLRRACNKAERTVVLSRAQTVYPPCRRA